MHLFKPVCFFGKPVYFFSQSIYLISFACVIFSSLAAAQDQPHTWPVKIKHNLTAPFFEQDELGYTPNIVQHSDGSLENIEGGAPDQTANTLITANCHSDYLPAAHTLKYADAFLDTQNNLHIVIHGATPSTRELIHLTQIGKEFVIDYQTKNIVFREKVSWQAVKANLVFKSNLFAAHTTLNAAIDLQLEGLTRFGSKVHTHIHGQIKPTIAESAIGIKTKLD